MKQNVLKLISMLLLTSAVTHASQLNRLERGLHIFSAVGSLVILTQQSLRSLGEKTGIQLLISIPDCMTWRQAFTRTQRSIEVISMLTSIRDSMQCYTAQWSTTARRIESAAHTILLASSSYFVYGSIQHFLEIHNRPMMSATDKPSTQQNIGNQLSYWAANYAMRTGIDTLRIGLSAVQLYRMMK